MTTALEACRAARQLFDEGCVVGVEYPNSWVSKVLDMIDEVIEAADNNPAEAIENDTMQL